MIRSSLIRYQPKIFNQKIGNSFIKSKILQVPSRLNASQASSSAKITQYDTKQNSLTRHPYIVSITGNQKNMESSKNTQEDAMRTPVSDLIESYFDLSAEKLPNTRGKYREQLCRTPLLPKTGQKKLNMLAHLIKGMKIQDAFLNLMFLDNDKAKEVLWALQEGCKIARDIQKFDPNNFYVAYAYISRGPITQGVDIKGRGRTGRIRSESSYMVIMLRDIKFLEEKMAKAKKKSPSLADQFKKLNRPIANAKIAL